MSFRSQIVNPTVSKTEAIKRPLSTVQLRLSTPNKVYDDDDDNDEVRIDRNLHNVNVSWSQVLLI